MKISRVEFENFRNFRDRGEILFPTDGSVTVIYGPNGVGKTTLHQLFQWIFYGDVHFNKTASNKMYNLEYEQTLPYGAKLIVSGTIDFEHPASDGTIEFYSIHRTWEYRKELPESKKINESVTLLKKVNDDWKKTPGDVSDFIEQHLPSGLAQYFFFDGESMIADLNQKGRDSAKSLRRALYSIFDLNIYEQAKTHIGSRSSGSSTVLGKLYLSKSDNSTDKDVIIARGNLRQAQNKLAELKDKLKKSEDSITRYKTQINELSELIGSTPLREDLEKRRAEHKKTIKALEDAIAKEVKHFGSDVTSNYPLLFISKIVQEAQFRIGLKIEDEKLIPGLTKSLVLALKKEDTCICGNKIGDAELQNLDEWLKKFPPLSYKYIYDQFKASAARWSANYDPDLLVEHLQSIFKLRDQISSQQKLIQEIDDELQNGTNVDRYIKERAAAESSVNYWEKENNKTNQEIGLQVQILKQRMKKYDECMAANKTNQDIDNNIQLMEAVYQFFDAKLHTSSALYSKQLCAAIQELLSKMLTSARRVEMTPNFELSVKDSYGDEAKSEGQFAVVSFAYIGGIFKLLAETEELRGKEFPLVLDGPFSKLDVIQRQNVINTIPSYAPQIILFSKDDLSPCFGSDLPDENIWTIYSNDERNISFVKRGYNREVFIINED